MQVEDHSQIQPTLTCPNITDVASPFLIGLLSGEVTIQKIRRDIELMVAIGCDLVFTRSHNGYAVLAHPLPGRRLRRNLPRGGGQRDDGRHRNQSP